MDLARAHPKPSHPGRPASGGLHIGHRRARRYRNTGYGRRSLAAGTGTRRSGPVRREGKPTGGMQSKQRRKRWTEQPLPP